MSSQAVEQPLVEKRPRQRRLGLGRLGRRMIRRFLLFVGLTLLIVVGGVVYVAWRQLQDARQLQQHMANWTAHSFDSWFQELDYSMAAMAEDPQIMDAPLATDLRQILSRSPAFRSVTVVDARPGKKGVEIITLAGHTFTGGRNLYREEWFFPTLESKTGSYVSSIEYIEGAPIVVVTHAVVRHDEVVGVVAAQADLSWAYQILPNARTEKGGYAYVIDESGQPVLHEYGNITSAHQPRTDIAAIHFAVLNQPIPDWPLWYQGLNPTSSSVVGAYAPTERPNWIVVAEQPLLADARFPGLVHDLVPLFVGAIIIVGLSALAATALGLYFSRQVAQPILLLREGAQRIGSGQWGHRIALRGRNSELTDLADEFNRMATGLQTALSKQEAWSHELETRVNERTGELSQALEQLQQEAATRETLLRTIQEISSPVIPVMDGIIVMPIVSTLDSARAQRVTEDLLAGIERERARVVLLDITGLPVVDTAVANALFQAARAGQLLGAQSILVGISPEVAETLVQLGIELHDLRTAATLQEGLSIALGILHRRVVSTR